jgi:hypothetical protein
MSFHPLTSSTATTWDEVVHSSDEGWPFGLSCWQRLILNVKEWKLVDCSFSFSDSGRALAVMPLQFNPNSRVMASSGWGGTGPIVVNGIAPKHRKRVVQSVLAHAEALAREAGAQRLEFWTSPVTRANLAAIWGVNPFVFFGFEDNSGVSQIVDLESPAEYLWQQVSETARHAVRRAEAAGITVEEAPWPDMLDSYYARHVETYRRTGVNPHPRAYFEGISTELWPKRYAVLMVARDAAGEAVAFHNSLRFGGSGLYHTGCSSAEALDCGANYLLFWHAMLNAKAAHIRWYDCGELAPASTDPKLIGLSSFKMKFGGTPHRFFKCRKTIGTSLSAHDVAHVAPRQGLLARAFSFLRRKARKS